MAKILILTSQNRDLISLERLFNKHLYETQFAYDRRSSEALLRYEKPNLFIWDTHTFESKNVQYLKNIRNMGYQSPILVMANEINNATENSLLDVKRAHYTKLPTEPSRLVKLTHKLIMDPNVKKQSHVRFSTDQSLEVEKILTGENYHSDMKNLSKGGAYCEFNTSVQLNKGDLTRLNLSLDNVNNSHKMNAQVVWKEFDSFQQKCGIGFRFLSTQDLYKYLMTQS
jgi:DNA-binding NtrC family response regulator